MASTVVTVFPVPGLHNEFSLYKDGRTQDMTYGPKITNGGDPGREVRIDITACNCGGLQEIKALNVLIGKVSSVFIVDVRR